MPRLKQHPVRRLLHFLCRMARQQIDHHAGMGWIEMLDQDEGHPDISR
jgi:hypothetical protein